MPTLQRVTTEYVVLEDRIKMTGELSPDDTMVLWLNQRLLLRLLPHLFLWLEKQGGDGIPSEILQSFAQEAATADLNDEPAVHSTQGAQTWLVSAIDITPDADNLLLRFKGTETQETTLPFSAQQLRQWLSILHKLWNLAEWPLDVWPQWLRSAAKDDAESSAATLYH